MRTDTDRPFSCDKGPRRAWDSRSPQPEGTAQYLFKNGIFAEVILKIHEGRPNIIDHLHAPRKNRSGHKHSSRSVFAEREIMILRIEAVKLKIPYTTTTSAASGGYRGDQIYGISNGSAGNGQAAAWTDKPSALISRALICCFRCFSEGSPYKLPGHKIVVVVLHTVNDRLPGRFDNVLRHTYGVPVMRS